MRQSLLASFLLLLSTFFVGCPASDSRESLVATFDIAGGEVSTTFPGDWYENPKTNPYDIHYFSSGQKMVTGLMIYDARNIASSSSAADYLNFHIDDLRSKRESFEVYEKQRTITTPHSRITRVVYSGERDMSKYYYPISLVEFNESDSCFLVSIQVAIPSRWEGDKLVLEDITKTIEFHPKHDADTAGDNLHSPGEPNKD